MRSISAGDIGTEEEDTKVFEPLDEPAEIPVPAEPAIPPVREPVPA